MVCVGIYKILGVIIICKHQGMTMKLVFITYLLLFPSTFIRLGIFFFLFFAPFLPDENRDSPDWKGKSGNQA